MTTASNVCSAKSRLIVENNSDFCSSCTVREFCLPVGLNNDNMEQLDKLVKSKKILQKDDLLFKGGDLLNKLYIVRSGSFKTYQISQNSQEEIINFNLPGEIMGFDALEQEHHTLYAKALETSSFCEITFKDLFLLAVNIPNLQRRLLTLASLRDEHSSLFSLNSSALERVSSLLINLSDRFKRRGLAQHKFFLSMSRQDIANYLGLTNETTSRMFTNLVKEEIIAIENRYVEILDFKKLQLCRCK